ncbi:hypothetical protein DQ240_12615 [Blastococcus sp. TF02A-26]|nr:hypothetical protein DQ240_12615 [Blastococcus sp. TF02A-26]
MRQQLAGTHHLRQQVIDRVTYGRHLVIHARESTVNWVMAVRDFQCKAVDLSGCCGQALEIFEASQFGRQSCRLIAIADQGVGSSAELMGGSFQGGLLAVPQVRGRSARPRAERYTGAMDA